MTFAAVVEIAFDPSHSKTFMSLLVENRALTLSREEHCLAFDILAPLGDDAGSSVLLYELYRCEQDFADHLRTSHFLDFEHKSQALVHSKVVRKLQLLGEDGIIPIIRVPAAHSDFSKQT